MAAGNIFSFVGSAGAEGATAGSEGNESPRPIDYSDAVGVPDTMNFRAPSGTTYQIPIGNQRSRFDVPLRIQATDLQNDTRLVHQTLNSSYVDKDVDYAATQRDLQDFINVQVNVEVEKRLGAMDLAKRLANPSQLGQPGRPNSVAPQSIEPLGTTEPLDLVRQVRVPVATVRVEKEEVQLAPPPLRRRAPDIPTQEIQQQDSVTTRSTAKLEPYDSKNEQLESFLARYENFADYFRWSPNDRLFHLKNSLGKKEAQILWDGGVYDTAAELVALLKQRFGATNQSERYTLELKNRRRQKGESLQELYHDIKRLLARGYDGKSGRTIESIGIDSFVNAFGDRELKKLVIQKGCTTLDEALTVALRSEAIELTTRMTTDTVQAYGPDGARLDRPTARVAGATDARETPSGNTHKTFVDAGWWHAQIGRPPKILPPGYATAYTPTSDSNERPDPYGYAGPDQSKFFTPEVITGYDPPEIYHTAQSYPPGYADTPSPNRNPRGGGPRRGRGGKQSEWVPGCYICGDLSHFKRDCPNLVEGTPKAAPRGGGRGSNRAAQTHKANGVRDRVNRPSTYIEIRIAGIKHKCLLDIGADFSLIPRKLVPQATLYPVQIEIFAANGTKIEVLGEITVAFKLEGINVQADLLVSDHVDEFMLGFDWMAKHEIQWISEPIE